jgi:hypothetical protein
MASQYSSKSPARHECTAPLSLDPHNSHTHPATRKEEREESAQRNEERERTMSSAHQEVNAGK